MRRERLNAYLFSSLNEARIMCEEWRTDYNEERPHKSLGYLSPIKFAELRPELYPQTVNENRLQIEENRLVDKAVAKTETTTRATLSN